METIAPSPAATAEYHPPAPQVSTARFHETRRMFARLHRYQLLMRKYWWMVPLCAILILLPVTFYTLKQPPSYASNARLLMRTRINVLEGKAMPEETANYIGTQIELLQSPIIRDSVISNLVSQFSQTYLTNKLIQQYLDRQIREEDLAAMLTPQGLADFKREWADFRKAADNFKTDWEAIKLQVKQMKLTAFFELRATGLDAEKTKIFLGKVINSYLDFKKELRDKDSKTTELSIIDQISQLNRELTASQDKLHDFLSSNNVVFLQEQGASAGGQLAGINKQLTTLKTEYQLLLMVEPEQVTDSTLGRVEDAPGKTNAPAEWSPELVASLAGSQSEHYKAIQQIQMFKFKRQELSQFLRPNHPKIQKLDEQIAGQEKLAVMFRQQSQSQLMNRRQTLQLQIQNLETASREWETRALDASRKMAEYDKLRQEYQRKQGLYDRLSSVNQSVDVNKNLEQEDFKIVQQPSDAVKVRFPFERLFLALAVGVLCGIGILYLLEVFDDRFASIIELRNHLTEMVVGQVPDLPRKVTGGKPVLELVHHNDDRHVFIESFRNLRSSLLFTFGEANRPRSILVTSSVPEEGKSTVAANLAATLALGGSKVLLMDADLRRSTLHKYFDLPDTPGLGEILAQETTYRQAIVPTKIPRLFLLPAGESEVNPGELFLSPSTDVFLREIYSQYDYIIVDSAPILATDDTSSLAPRMDGVLFVVRGSFTSSRMAQEAIDLLRQRKVNVLGLVFNRAIATASEYYYYYRYNNYYRRRPRSSAKTPLPAGAVTGDPAPAEAPVPK